MAGHHHHHIFLTRLIIILPVLLLIVAPTSFVSANKDFPSTIENKHLDKVYERGKSEMENVRKLMEQSRLPREQNCWKSVLEDLEISCKLLTQDIQSRLAFSFTSCFTQMSGVGTVICDESTDIKDCFRALNPTMMNIYHSYFLHTQDMCFYLQHQVWQEKTENAVSQLTTAAVDVAKTMEDSKDAQTKILESQKESVKVQSDLLKDNNVLYRNIIGVKQVFEEFKTSADEHRIMFFEMFEKLTRMQKLVSWIQGEMSFFDMMGFYFSCMIFGFFATSTQRTHQARFWLIILLIMSLAAERYAFAQLSQSSQNYLPEEVQSYIWCIRKATVIMSILTIIIAAARYRDYQIINNSMLNEMHSRMDVLVQFIQDLSTSGAKIPIPFPSELNSELKSLNVNQNETKEDNGENNSSSESSFSNYSTESDSEFLGEDVKGELNDESFSLEEASPEVLQKTPANNSNVSLFQRLFPLNTNDENSSTVLEPPPSSPTEYAFNSPNNTSSHRYFLRERKTPLRENVVLQQESVTEFAKKIKQSRKSVHNQFKAERAKRFSCFSSDDEF